jgi:hypothetical protein
VDWLVPSAFAAASVLPFRTTARKYFRSFQSNEPKLVIFESPKLKLAAPWAKRSVLILAQAFRPSFRGAHMMTLSLMLRYGVIGTAGGFGCLVVAYGFDAAGQASLQEAVFRSSVYYHGTLSCLHCGVTGSEAAGNRPGLALE